MSTNDPNAAPGGESAEAVAERIAARRGGAVAARRRLVADAAAAAAADEGDLEDEGGEAS